MNQRRFRSIALPALALASASALVLTGCSSNSGGDSGSDEVMNLTLAHTVETTNPIHACGAQVFKDSVETASDGKITVEIFPSSTLGTEAAIADSTIAGDIDISLPSTGHLATYSPQLSVLGAAFLFDDYDGMLEVSRGDIGQQLWQDLNEQTGLHFLDMLPLGIREVTTKDVEVRTPDDLNGIAMRAADAPIWITNVTALGATPTPMALGEVYTGLQQGVIDAEENPVALIESQSFDEVQNVLSLTNHVVQGNPLLINGDRWDSLDEAQQGILTAAAQEAAASMQKCLEDDFDKIVSGWEDAGTMTVVRDVDVDAFREHAVPILLDQFGDVWGNLYEDIRDAQE